jgi:uncharacterized phiE125 gp8 family phage protein
VDLELVTDAGPTSWQSIVTIADAKLNSRIFNNVLDNVFTNAVRAAIEYFDYPNGMLNRSILQRTFRMHFKCFPESGRYLLPMPPLVSVTSVAYRNAAGTVLTLDPANYVVKNDGVMPAEIAFVEPDGLPDTKSHPRAVSIEFAAGYATGAVPELLKRGVLVLAAHYVENPEATINEQKVVTINRKIDFGLDYIIKALRVPVDYSDWQ